MHQNQTRTKNTQHEMCVWVCARASYTSAITSAEFNTKRPPGNRMIQPPEASGSGRVRSERTWWSCRDWVVWRTEEFNFAEIKFDWLHFLKDGADVFLGWDPSLMTSWSEMFCLKNVFTLKLIFLLIDKRSDAVCV